MVAIVAAAASGEVDVSLFLIFPVFSGSSALFLIGTLLIVLSFIVGFVMLAMGQVEIGNLQTDATGSRPQQGSQKQVKYGGVVLVGPVPIAFGSERSIAIFMMILGVIIAVMVLGIVLLLV